MSCLVLRVLGDAVGSFCVCLLFVWFGLICSLWLLVFGYVVFGGFPEFGLRVVVVCFPVDFCWVSG